MNESSEKKLQHDLSGRIFNTEFILLDYQQELFIMYHIKQFVKYQREAASQFMGALKKKKLVKEYDQIKGLYLDRVSLEDIKYGILDGLKTAQEFQVTFLSFGWFRQWIEARCKKRLEFTTSEISKHFDESVDCPWYFSIWLLSHTFQGDAVAMKARVNEDYPWMWDQWGHFEIRKRDQRKKKPPSLKIVALIRKIRMTQDQMFLRNGNKAYQQKLKNWRRNLKRYFERLIELQENSDGQ